MKEKGLLILGSKKFKEKSLFDVVKNGDLTTLKMSKCDNSWTKPGKKSSQLYNHGNGFTFYSFYPTGELRAEIDLDYDEAHELRALLKLVDDSGETFNFLKESE